MPAVFKKFSLAQRVANKGTFLLITGAFVLYLLVTISTGKVQSLNFLSYNFPASGGNASVSLQFGMYGSCRQVLGGARICDPVKLPYLVDLSGLPGRVNASNPYVVGKLSGVLVLFPIAMFLALLGMATSFVNPHLSLLNCQGAFLLGQVAMICMFILFERTDTQVRQAYPTVTGGLGKCLWMALAACLSAGVGVLFAIMGNATETRRHGSLIEKPVYV